MHGQCSFCPERAVCEYRFGGEEMRYACASHDPLSPAAGVAMASPRDFHYYAYAPPLPGSAA